jgi:predicted transcriptional regulator
VVLKDINRELYESLRNLRNKKIKEVIEPLSLVEEDTTISKVIGIATEKQADEVFIHSSTQGILHLSKRDILNARDINSTKVSTFGKRVPTLTENDTIGNASRLMSLYSYRAIPVVDHMHNDKAMGQVRSKTILKYIQDAHISSKEVKVNASTIMSSDLVTITTEDMLPTAKEILLKEKIDHLPIVEKKDNSHGNPSEILRAMVRSDDMIKYLTPSEGIGRRTIGMDDKVGRLEAKAIDIADENIVTSGPHDSINSIIGTILKSNSTYTIVKTQDNILGIITHRDIVALLGEQIQQDIPVYIMGLPDDPFDAELVKSKFTNIIKLLSKTSPDIEEARCRIRIADIGGERTRYQVKANIFTPHKRHVYTSDREYDLARIFDEMSNSLKNQLAHKKTDKQRESIRHAFE